MGEGARFRFGDFILDTGDRQLSRDGAEVELSPRYFDALAVLVREQGRLVDKDLFFAEVWRGVIVGDEALTQCIKTLRRSLGDDAGNPRFIQTVPKHGYRFVAAVERLGGDAAPAPHTTAGEAAAAPAAAAPKRATVPAMVLGGTAGGALSGLVGGLIYGVAAISSPGVPALGANAMLALLIASCVAVGALGAFGVSIGFALAGAGPARLPLRVAGGALGGLVIGALIGSLGADAFGLLLGEAPAGITGGREGAALGGALALGIALGERRRSRLASALGAGAAAAAAGVLIVLAGGRMMAGSLASLAAAFLGADVVAGRFQPFFAAMRFGEPIEALLGGLEGLLFGLGVGGAIALVRRRLGASGPA